MRVNAKMNKVPLFVISLMMRLAHRSDGGRELAKLVYTFPLDFSLVKGQESMYEKYLNIQAGTLLLGGDLSPEYLIDALHILAKTIPKAKIIVMPGLDHTAPNGDQSGLIVSQLKQFLK